MWEKYNCVYRDVNQEENVSSIDDLNKLFHYKSTHTDHTSIWQNNETGEFFLGTPFGLIHNGHRAHGLAAGTTSTIQGQFGKTICQHFFNNYFGNRSLDYGDIKVDEEIVYTENDVLAKVKNASVLVLGGGPTLDDLDLDKVKDYDIVISCNSYFKSEKLKDVKVDIALVGQGTDLADPELVQRIKRDETLIGFEHSHKLTIQLSMSLLRQMTQTLSYI